MDMFDDNGDTATILEAKMEHASVAILMLDAGFELVILAFRVFFKGGRLP